MLWEELRELCLENGFKERTKSHSVTLRKEGVYFLYHGSMQGIKIFTQNDRGGYDMFFGHLYRKTPTFQEAVQYALAYKPPQVVERQWHNFTQNKDITTIVRNNRACLGVAICAARIIGIVGVKWPKADFNWIDDPAAEIYYVMRCCSPDDNFEIVTNGDQVALCNVSKGSEVSFIKIINGAFGGRRKIELCKELGAFDQMVVKAAIEQFKTVKPWKGIDYSGGGR